MEINQAAQTVQAKQAAQPSVGMPQIPNLGIPNIPNFTIPNIPQPTQPTNFGPVVFDSTEILEMNGIRESYDQLTIALGQLEMQKRELGKNERRVQEKLVAIEAQEKVFLDKIVAKYGEGTFDVNTGIFTPKQ